MEKQDPLIFLTATILIISNCCISIESRTVVPFQYGWRFHYGDDPSSPPLSGPGSCSTAFEEDLQDYNICDGMERNPNRFSEKDCRLACCYDPTCLAWQAYPLALGRECYHAYIGMNISCTRPDKPSGMGGGRRQNPPNPAFRTDYTFATEDAMSSIDSEWPLVDAPHDFIAEYGNFTNDVTNFKQGYLPRNASWYRKHFKLPEPWKSDGGSTFVHFEGIFHHATIFLNGIYLLSHECGYTGFTVRLDNATNLRYGDQQNVLSVRADASFGSGHWYEGGGIYRPVYLIHIPSEIQIVHDGLFVPPESDGKTVNVTVELENLSSEKSKSSDNNHAVNVKFILSTMDGAVEIASTISDIINVNPESTVIVSAQLIPKNEIDLWSIQNPTLYTVRAEVFRVNDPVFALDSSEVEVGFRTTSWEKKDSFVLNGEGFKLRGFSHHNSIGGLGVAIPERINLFRVQASRALGSNIWRMSHNPYVSSLYKLLDITGVVCWDENRDYGAKYMNGAYVNAMRDMVKRDRNHPSVVIWSFCNEYECHQNDPLYSVQNFKTAVYDLDGTRPVTANDISSYDMSDELDVQGASHSNEDKLEQFHNKFPEKPLVLSECCSCESQRPDRDVPPCIPNQNNPGLLDYVSGSLGVWTLMDYFGEPHGTGTDEWPYVSCDFGQFDIAGFPKPHSYWYVVNWLQAFSSSNTGRPPLPTETVVRVLSLPTLTGSKMKHTIEAITTAPFAELFLDGTSQGIIKNHVNNYDEFTSISWSIGNVEYNKNITVVGLSAMDGGEVLAHHSVMIAEKDETNYKIKLDLDVPSISTGTGNKLVLDGRDTGMIRASIVDSARDDALVNTATNRITWRIVSGPGVLAGVSNGDPTSHEWMKSDSVDAFGGLARGLFRVSLDCTSEERELAATIDVEKEWPSPSECKEDPIVVEASSPGLLPIQISIPISTNVAKDNVFTVAGKSTRDAFYYLDEFVG